METFPSQLDLCEGDPLVIGGFPHRGQWRGALMFICSTPEKTVEETLETPAIWDAITLVMTVIRALEIGKYPNSTNIAKFISLLKRVNGVKHWIVEQQVYFHHPGIRNQK